MRSSKVSPFTPAEETLGMSSAARGLQGMERTSAPKGPNLMDGGALSKPSLNAQPSNNARYEDAERSTECRFCPTADPSKRYSTSA